MRPQETRHDTFAAPKGVHGRVHVRQDRFIADFPRWIASCILLFAMSTSSACFYFGPLPQLRENEPPAIVKATPEQDTPLVLHDQPARMFVIASDTDGVHFYWSLSDGTQFGPGTLIDASSSYFELSPNPALDGQFLYCLVVDGAKTDPASTELSWPLEVP